MGKEKKKKDTTPTTASPSHTFFSFIILHPVSITLSLRPQRTSFTRPFPSMIACVSCCSTIASEVVG